MIHEIIIEINTPDIKIDFILMGIARLDFEVLYYNRLNQGMSAFGFGKTLLYLMILSTTEVVPQYISL